MLKLNEYLKKKQLEISSTVRERIPIYLDVNYWIRLREEEKSTNPSEKELLSIVNELSASKKCFFPISEITFWEIMKQSDLTSRRETLAIVDRLSEGLSLIRMKDRVHLETRVWFLKSINMPVYDTEDLIWTKAILMAAYEAVATIPDTLLHQSFLDSFCDKSLLQLIGDSEGRFTYKDNVELFNQNFKKYAHENKTEEEMFLSELGGYIDVHSEAIKDVTAAEFFRKSGRYPTEEERQLDKLPQIIYNLIRLKKISNELPIFHIVPTLQAWCRWIKKPFKDGNDTIDFYHASFALPYCSYFLTDRRLCSAIKQTKLDKTYNCIVEHSYSSAIELLRSISLDKQTA